MALSRYFTHKTSMVDPGDALPGRTRPAFAIPELHAVLGAPLQGPWPEGSQVAYFGLGCFWGAERRFWRMPGVISTAVGYMGGFTPNPTYDEVCTGRTGHTEAVQVVYDPTQTTYEALLAAFWEIHDPTQGNRQGNDVGTQYRSAAYPVTAEQQETAERTRDIYAKALAEHGLGPITTEVRPASAAGDFYYAEGAHQQYLYKNPHGYDCHASAGVPYPA